MRVYCKPFVGLTKTSLVREGVDYKHPERGHVWQVVYGEMFMQICMYYNSLPDPKSLKAHEVKIFYEGLRPTLQKDTRPK